MAIGSYIIGIAGGSGSGKTSFMKALKEVFTNEEVCFISLDDYYKPREEQLSDAEGVKNFDLPSSIVVSDLVYDIEQLLAGQTVEKEKYLFNNSDAESYTFSLFPASVVVVEGLFIYHYKELKNHFDLKLYIDAAEELKLIRRIKRDKEERNYPLEDVLYRYEHHVLPAYHDYIMKYKKEADLVINNNKDFKAGLDVVTSHIRSKLMAQE